MPQQDLSRSPVVPTFFTKLNIEIESSRPLGLRSSPFSFALQAQVSLDNTTSRLLSLIATAAEPEALLAPGGPEPTASFSGTGTFASDFFPALSTASGPFARLPTDMDPSESFFASPSVGMMPRIPQSAAFSGSDGPYDHHERADSSELIEWALALPDHGGGARSPHTRHTRRDARCPRP